MRLSALFCPLQGPQGPLYEVRSVFEKKTAAGD